ncbi:hypothetical protein [Nonomuraea bangladeshensis]|uniref:hypothetical protein n=1 Tax=Nonomuraea bangladeshensis TaxID=404385 RepID=UPI003C2E3426
MSDATATTATPAVVPPLTVVLTVAPVTTTEATPGLEHPDERNGHRGPAFVEVLEIERLERRLRAQILVPATQFLDAFLQRCRTHRGQKDGLEAALQRLDHGLVTEVHDLHRAGDLPDLLAGTLGDECHLAGRACS